jgi:hypothetical protein
MGVLAATLFYYLPGFYLKTGFMNPHPLSMKLTLFLIQGPQPITIKGWDFSQWYIPYTP